MITQEQIKAGRAMLGWSQAKLAETTGMTREGIARIEAGKVDPRTSSILRIKSAMESAGLVFIDDGVRLP